MYNYYNDNIGCEFMNNLNLFYYIVENNIMISTEKEDLKEITEKEVSAYKGLMYFLINIDQKILEEAF